MIAKIKTNISFYEYPQEFTGDIYIKEITCPICKRTLLKVHISEHRPLAPGDDNLPQVAIAYNTSSPRGRLAERQRKRSYDVLMFDVYNNFNEYLVVISNCCKFKFLQTERHYNPKLWDVPNAIHIYEDHYCSLILWADKIRENFEGIDPETFLIKIKKPHGRCLNKYEMYELGCTKIYENDGLLLINKNNSWWQFKPGIYKTDDYNVKNIEEKLNIKILNYIERFNERSKHFEIRITGDIIEVIKK